jgi:hypothetical protein
MADRTSSSSSNTPTINSTAAKVTKRKPAPKKKTSEGVDEDDNGAEDEVDFKPKRRAKKVKKAEVESEEGEEMVGVKVKEEVREDEEF